MTTAVPICYTGPAVARPLLITQACLACIQGARTTVWHVFKANGVRVCASPYGLQTQLVTLLVQNVNIVFIQLS